MKVPFYLEATWNLESGDFSYVKFKIDRIEYNLPKNFYNMALDLLFAFYNNPNCALMHCIGMAIVFW